VVDEGPLAVDLHHGKPLAITGLQLWNAVDLHLLQVEPDLPSGLCHDSARALAEMTTLSVVDDDPGLAPRGGFPP
jgi:hypothetical protein